MKVANEKYTLAFNNKTNIAISEVEKLAMVKVFLKLSERRGNIPKYKLAIKAHNKVRVNQEHYSLDDSVNGGKILSILSTFMKSAKYLAYVKQEKQKEVEPEFWVLVLCVKAVQSQLEAKLREQGLLRDVDSFYEKQTLLSRLKYYLSIGKTDIVVVDTVGTLPVEVKSIKCNPFDAIEVIKREKVAFETKYNTSKE